MHSSILENMVALGMLHTGYIKVSATAGNVVEKDGYLFDGILYTTIGDCWVAGTQVAVGVYGEYVS